MRSIMIAAVTAAGIGLLATSSSFAAPASGAGIRDIANAGSNVEHVWCRWRCRHGGWSRRWCRRWCW